MLNTGGPLLGGAAGGKDVLFERGRGLLNRKRMWPADGGEKPELEGFGVVRQAGTPMLSVG